MKIVKFLGGLGNQMFQYAFYLFLKQHFNKVKVDLTGFSNYHLHNGYELEHVFGIRLRQADPFEIRLYTPERRDWTTRKLRRLYGTKKAWYSEKEEFAFDPLIAGDKGSRYYWGYWQHYHYIKDIEPQLRESFQFRQELSGQNSKLLNEVSGLQTVSLHVRRGDYLGHPLLGGICESDYYQDAVGRMKQQLQDPVFIVFSNDINWCEKSLPLENAVYVNWNTGTNSYMDMQLMSCCRHHIIANSSFSWWGAWLNDDERKKVIAPGKWVNVSGSDSSGLLPPNWTRI